MMKRLLTLVLLTMAIAVSAQDGRENRLSKVDTSLARRTRIFPWQPTQTMHDRIN